MMKMIPHERTLAGTLGMVIEADGIGRMIGRIPVELRNQQPYGALHGGAIAALVETLASHGTVLGLDLDREIAFGQEINYSLLRTVWDGWVHATAQAIHRGKTTWIWDAQVVDDQNRLVAVARCTIAVRPQRPSNEVPLNP